MESDDKVSIIIATTDLSIVKYVMGNYDGTHITIDSQNKMTGIEMIGGRKLVEKLGNEVSLKFPKTIIKLEYVELELGYEGSFEFLAGTKIKQDFSLTNKGNRQVA